MNWVTEGRETYSPPLPLLTPCAPRDGGGPGDGGIRGAPSGATRWIPLTVAAADGCNLSAAADGGNLAEEADGYSTVAAEGSGLSAADN